MVNKKKNIEAGENRCRLVDVEAQRWTRCSQVCFIFLQDQPA
jgi:hypothetical protein